MFDQPSDPNPFDEEEQPAEESSNRTFLIIAGILIGIVCLTVVGLGIYAVKNLPAQASAAQTQNAVDVAENVTVYQTLTALAQSDMLSQTPAATATKPATATPPIAVAQASATAAPLGSATATLGAASTSDPQTATVAAALTQAAQAQLTVTFLPTSTALPKTGFADEAGLPGLFVMAVVLVMVILLARRLRSAPVAR